MYQLTGQSILGACRNHKRFSVSPLLLSLFCFSHRKFVGGMSDDEGCELGGDDEAGTAQLSLSDILGVLNKPEKQVCPPASLQPARTQQPSV